MKKADWAYAGGWAFLLTAITVMAICFYSG